MLQVLYCNAPSCETDSNLLEEPITMIRLVENNIFRSVFLSDMVSPFTADKRNHKSILKFLCFD